MVATGGIAAACVTPYCVALVHGLKTWVFKKKLFKSVFFIFKKSF